MSKKYKNKNRTTSYSNRSDEMKIITSANQESVSEEQLYDVLNFAQQIYGGSFVGNVMTPELTNSRLKDVSTNPLAATQADIEKALLNPKNHERQLIGYSEFFELTSMIYKRTLMYLANILSFSIKDLVCVNAEQKDYSSAEYKKDYKEICDFIDKFKIQEEFPKVMREIIRKDSYFSVLRDEGDKYTLQELPQDYCILTGRFPYGWLFDFNMYWFMQPGVDINMYPPVFRQMYNEVFANGNPNYNASANISMRDGSYVYWAQTSPVDGFWAWKMNPETATRLPYLAPMFQDVVLQPMMRQLQTNKYIVESTKVMVGLIPLLQDAKAGSVKDMIAISSETAGKFLSLLKRGISDVIKTGAVPFSDVKILDFEGGQRNNLEDFTKTTTSMSGVNSKLTFPFDKMNSLETQYSKDVDFFTIAYIYKYFDAFLNYHMNKRTSKFKWQITLGGTSFDTDKKERREDAGFWADKGVVLPNRIAYALDMPPHHLYKQLEEANASGFTDLLIPLLNIFTQTDEGEGSDKKSSTKKSGGTKKSTKSTTPSKPKGRPKKSLNELSESGVQTRQDASNVGKKS